MKIKTKILTLLLAAFMFVGIIPANVFAEEYVLPTSVNVGTKANPGPNWGDDGETGDTVDGDGFWALPQGVRLINAQNGSDPLNSLGFTYKGHYTDDKGREVVNLNVSHKHTVSSSVWTHFVMKTPGELFNKIDWDASYISHQFLETYGVEFLKFTESPIAGQKKYTKAFPFKDAGVNYRHYDVNLVLKKGNTWENTFANKNHVLQLRLFDNKGTRIFSTSVSERKKKSGYKFTLPNYNSYTKSATIPGKSDLPKDWILSTTTSMANLEADNFYTADSVLQLDKEKGVVRIIYLKTNADGNPEYGFAGQELALRQSFDKDFVKYLDLTKDKIGTIRTYKKDEGVYGEEIAIFPYHLNGVKKDSLGNPELNEQNQPTYNRTDGSVFIQASTAAYEDKHTTEEGFNEADKISLIKQPKGQGGNIRGDQTNEANITVFEYYIKPEIIEKELIKTKTFVKNFFFDTRFVTNNSRGMVKYTATLDKDLVVPGGNDIFLNVSFTPELSLSDGMTASVREEDFILNLGGPEGISKSWKRNGHYWSGKSGSYKYLIPTYGWNADKQTENVPNVGYTIKAGQEITVYVPAEHNGSTNSAVFTVEKINKGSNYKNTTTVKYPETNEDIRIELTKADKPVYNPMYIPNTVSTIGGTAYRLKFPPIVDEIFTDGEESKHFTGYSKSADGIIGSEVKVGDNIYTGKYTITSDTEGNKGEILKIYTADGNDALVERRDDEVVGQVTIDGKTYNGFKFDIKQQFVDKAPSGHVADLELLKDMPVVFRTGNSSSLDSEPVVEQVQARVKFDWNIPTTDPEQAKDPLVKIAPLNKELRTIPVNVYEGTSLVKKAGDPNEAYKVSGFAGDNVSFLNHNGVDLEGEELAKRQFPGKETEDQYRTKFPTREDDQTTADVDESQFKILGWSTKKNTSAVDFISLEELTSEEQWADDTKAYKFTEKSPIDMHHTVYAVWGEGSAIPVSPAQNYNAEDDIQFIGGSFDKKVDADSVVTLVKKDPENEGKYIPVLDADGEAITGTINEDGNGFKFILRDGSVNHIAQLDETTEYKVQLAETGREKTVSEESLTLDLTAPTIELGLELDELGIYAKLTGTTNDEKSKVLKVNVIDGENSPIEVTLNDNGFDAVSLPLDGQAKTYKAIAIDAMGNKSDEVVKTVEAAKEKVDLKMYAPYVGENIIFVQSAAETTLKISIVNNGNVIHLQDQTVTTNDYEEIKLLKEDGGEYKLQRRDRVVVKAENPNFESNSIVQRAR